MRSSAGPVRTLVLLVCVLLQACYGSSDPNKETCYSRQHRGVWVNEQVALTNTGIVMEARDMPSEKDCILNCCSEDVKPGLRCNLVVFRPRNQSISENCLLFHCPGERDCPLSVAASGVNTYNIFKGLTHPATKLNRTTTKPAPHTDAHTTTTQATTKTPTTPLTTTAQTLSASVIDLDASTAYGLEEDFTESSLPVLLMTKSLSTLTSIQPSTTPTRATTTTTLATTTTTPPTTTTTPPTTTTTQPTTTTTQPTTTTTQPTTTTTQRTTTTTQHTTTTTTQHLLAAIATSIRPARPLSHPSVKVNRPRKPSKPQRGQEAHSVAAQLTSTRAHAQASTAPTTTTSTMSSTATITSTTTTSTMSSSTSTTSTTSSRVPPAAETQSHFKDRQFPEAGLSKPEKPKISWMMWKNSLVAIVVITLIFLVFLLALAGRKAMESFDRRHYTRLELNDLHYEV